MRRHLAWSILFLFPLAAPAGEKVARFQVGDAVGYGLVEGDAVRLITGDPFGPWQRTDRIYPLAKVKFLPPTRPSQVLALAGNYKSHLPGQEIAPKFQIVQPFHKPPACLVGHGDAIVLPEGTSEVH